MKPQIRTDRKLAGFSLAARLTFIYTWTIADDDGLFRAEPRQLLGDLYPHDKDVLGEELDAWFDELVEIGWIRWRWTKDWARVGEIVNWEKHQLIKNRSKPFLLNELQALSVEPPEDVRRASVDPGGAESRVLSPESGVLSPDSVPTEPAVPDDDRVWKTVAAVALRAAGVSEKPADWIADSIKNFWPLAVRDSNDEELAAFVTYYGTTKIKGPWNPARFWNLRNDYGHERFREELAEWRRDRPKSVDPYTAPVDRTEHVGDATRRVTQRLRA